MRRALSLSLAALLLSAPAHPLFAQGPQPDGSALPALTARDSARALHTAREEQADFERVRFRNLPWTWTDGGSGPCDEQIGRFCLTFGEGDDHWAPPPDPQPVTDARDELLAVLDSVAALIPGDHWVTGQRVRYLVEARRFADADSAARACRAGPWWCDALSGFALHYAGDAVAADSAFAAMLRAMPGDEREDWTDLSALLSDRAVHAYRRLDGEDRTRFERRYWQLCDPFLSRPGNELLAEHFSRDLLDALQDRARTTEAISWGSDLRQLLLRYGWPSGWERVRESGYRLPTAGPARVVTHYSRTQEAFCPPDGVLLDDDPDSAVWEMDPEQPRAAYDVAVGDSVLRWLHPVDHQLSLFHRGDSVVVVVGYRLPADSFPTDTKVDAALALSADPDSTPRVVRLESAPLQGGLALTAAPGTLLASLEIVADSARRAVRERQTVRVRPLPADSPALSDLLLLRSADELPDSLAAAAAEARGTDRVHRGEPLGIYWEVYGLDDDGPNLLTLAVRLVNRHQGWMRRLAERVGMVHAEEPIRMKWQEPTAGGSYLPRSLFIEIPADLDPGTYDLEVSAELIGHAPLVATRQIEVY